MVYIQSDIERKLPHHFDAACGMFGALDNNNNIRLTSYDEVSSGKFDLLIKQNLFIGSTEFMTEVFKRVGKEVPSMAPSQPFEIYKLCEIKKEIKNGKKVFVKPVKSKLFSGMVYDIITVSSLDPYPEDSDVFVMTPFNQKLISEWRCYIRNNGICASIVDSRNYSGDFKISPDYYFIEKTIKSLNNYPSSYTIDIGILENGKNVVIEYNDMWAIGNYGIDNTDYYKLLRLRYFEIMNKN